MKFMLWIIKEEFIAKLKNMNMANKFMSKDEEDVLNMEIYD